MMEKPNLEKVDPRWRDIYKAGAVAPWITLAIYFAQFLAISLVGDEYPSSASDWFTLIQRNKIIGLLYLNAFDVVSIAVLGIMFLALYVALKKHNESYMAIAAFFAFLGVATFVSARADYGASMLIFSDQFEAATAQAQMDQWLAAAEGLLSLLRGTPDTMGYFYMAIGGLIISIVILREETFGKAAAFVGILGGGLTLANRISVVAAPSFTTPLMIASGFVWLVWYILISRGLYRFARMTAEA